MWAYFNKNGQLKETVTNGTFARVGTTHFQIYVVVDEIMEKYQNAYNKATITLYRPELAQFRHNVLNCEGNCTHKVELNMKYARTQTYSKEPEDGDTHFLEDGKSYKVFYIDFNDTATQTYFSAFDMSGYWTAVITLLDMSGNTVVGKNVLDNIKFLCY